MSTPDEQARYKAMHDDPKAPARALRDHGYIQIENFQFWPVGDGKSRTHEYVVKFDRRVMPAGQPVPPKGDPYTVQIAFQFHPEYPMASPDRRLNVTGLQVLSYRVHSDTDREDQLNAESSPRCVAVGRHRSGPGVERPAGRCFGPAYPQGCVNQMDRTVLVGEIGRETTVTFAANERIGRVVFGAPEAELWEGPDPKDIEKQPLQNNLPLWPLKIGATNMQVTTTLPDGSQRIYQFALFAKAPDTDGQDDPDVTFGLIFTYPEVVKQEAVAAWKARRAAADAAAAKATAKARLAVDGSMANETGLISRGQTRHGSRTRGPSRR